jgi:hypothetical protein
MMSALDGDGDRQMHQGLRGDRCQYNGSFHAFVCLGVEWGAVM